MAPGQKPLRLTPAWRPFAGPLSPQSVRQALSIINGLFNWLVQAGYLNGRHSPYSLSLHRAPMHGACPPPFA